MGPILFFILCLIPLALSWTTPEINPPTYTYQCMLMELTWKDGEPPYSIWFSDGNNDAPRPGLGAWHNLTGQNYLVPCVAPAGSNLRLILQDSTGWISMSRGTFLVLSSTNSSCLHTSSNAAGLSESQSIFSTMLDRFHQSIINDILAKSTASSTYLTVVTSSATSEVPSRSATAIDTTPSSKPVNLWRILGPVLASLFVILICIAAGICFLRGRRRARRMSDAHIPLNSNSEFDLLDGESVRRVPSASGVGTGAQDAGGQGAGGQAEQAEQAPAMEMTAIEVGVTAPRSRLRLHEAWPSTVKNRLSEVPPIPENENASEEPYETRTRTEPRSQDLEQRAEQLSGPELERLAALVARRLERVRGAPPQYQATEGVGV